MICTKKHISNWFRNLDALFRSSSSEIDHEHSGRCWYSPWIYCSKLLGVQVLAYVSMLQETWLCIVSILWAASQATSLPFGTMHLSKPTASGLRAGPDGQINPDEKHFMARDILARFRLRTCKNAKSQQEYLQVWEAKETRGYFLDESVRCPMTQNE